MSSITTAKLPSTHHTIIPHTSFAATRFWYIARAIQLVRHTPVLGSWLFPPLPVPPKGQQTWTRPLNSDWINRHMGNSRDDKSIVEEWNEETSGWDIPVFSPPLNAAKSSGTERVLLYFHGSAFQAPPLDLHWGWAAYLSRELNAEVIFVPYPLAPTNNGKEAMPVLTKLYESALTRAGSREFIVAGDSAGGNVALSLTFAVHEAGLTLPSQVLSIAPMIHLPLDNPKAKALERFDPFLDTEFIRRAGLLWAGVPIPQGVNSFYSVPFPDEVAKDPKLNPSAGDLNIFIENGIRLVLVSGTYDILHPDIEDYAQKAEKAGVEVAFIEGEHQFHGFTNTVSVSPECRQGAELIVRQIISNGRRS